MRFAAALVATTGLWCIPLGAQLPREMITATAVTNVPADQLDVVGIVGGAVTPAGTSRNICDIGFSNGMISAADSCMVRISGSARLSCPAVSVGSEAPR